MLYACRIKNDSSSTVYALMKTNPRLYKKFYSHQGKMQRYNDECCEVDVKIVHTYSTDHK